MRDPQTHLANVRRFVEQVLNRREYVVMYELFSPKHELLAPDPLPSVTGISPYAGNIQHFHEGFSDYCVTVRDRKIGNKGIIERQVVEGTHDGAFLGIAGTGKRLCWEADCVYEFDRRGLIRRSWLQADVLGIVRQIRNGAV